MQRFQSLVLLSLLAVGALAAAESASVPIVRTVGEAKAAAQPDKAEFRFSVITYGEQASEASRINAERTDKILADLRAKLGSEAVVKTEGYRIQPNRKFSKKGPEEVTGYSVHHTVYVSTKDLDALPEIFDGLSSSGVDQINQVHFVLDDPTSLRRQALVDAVAMARAEADAIAEALGSKVARIVSVDEEGATSRPVQRYGQVMETMAVGSAAPPIQIGEVEVSARVTLAVELTR